MYFEDKVSNIHKQLSLGYQYIMYLRFLAVKRELKEQQVSFVEDYFKINYSRLEGIDINDCSADFKKLYDFWESCDFYTGIINIRGKRNLFTILRGYDLHKENKFYSEDEFSIVLKNLEKAWLSFSQSYRGQYIRNIQYNRVESECLVRNSQSPIINVLKKLEIVDLDLKQEIDERLDVGIELIMFLKEKYNARTLSSNEIVEVESYFAKNQFELNEVIVSKYYSRYIKCVSDFWNICQSKEKEFNLFDSIREGSSKEVNRCFSVSISEMKELWIACDHIYTMCQIRTIRKKYML